MPNALTDTNISTTYAGVLHAQGEPIPATGLKVVYDGIGNKSSLSVGREGQGIRVTGTIIADSIAVDAIRGFETSSVQAIVDLIYPVGALLITTNSTAPSYPGTTWVRQAEGKFIAGVGTGNDGVDQVAIVAGDDNNQANQGKYNVTLDTSQMPRHKHGIKLGHEGNVGGTNDIYGYPNTDASGPYAKHDENETDGSVSYPDGIGNPLYSSGGDQPHTNIPPWFGAYVWERTS